MKNLPVNQGKTTGCPCSGFATFEKSFDPFKHKRQVVRLEVLTYNLRAQNAVSYFTKALDIIIQGWSMYLSIIADVLVGARSRIRSRTANSGVYIPLLLLLEQRVDIGSLQTT